MQLNVRVLGYLGLGKVNTLKAKFILIYLMQDIKQFEHYMKRDACQCEAPIIYSLQNLSLDQVHLAPLHYPKQSNPERNIPERNNPDLNLKSV